MAASDKRYAHTQAGVLKVGTGAATATLTGGVYVIVPGTLATDTTVNHDVTVSTTLGKITNSAPHDRVVRVTADLTLTHSAGSDRTVTVGIEVDGVVVESMTLTVVTATATRFSFGTIALLPAASFVRLLVKQASTEALTSTTGGKMIVYGV